MLKQTLPRKTAYQLRAGLQMRQFGLDQGIYDHETKQIFMLNPIAGLILNYLQTGKPHEEIAQNILIACGKSTTKPEQVTQDLEKTVKELLRLKLVEPARSPGEKSEDLLLITENEMTSLSIPYLAPQVKAYTMAELLKKYNKGYKVGLGDVSFCDTWAPQIGKVSFSDTWKPDVKPGIQMKTVPQLPKTGRDSKGIK